MTRERTQRAGLVILDALYTIYSSFVLVDIASQNIKQSYKADHCLNSHCPNTVVLHQNRILVLSIHFVKTELYAATMIGTSP